jgi:hypothetical protein
MPTGEGKTLEIEANKPFKWPKGLCLSPTSPVTILLPGGLIQNEETIGSIIEVPDDADIGFRNAHGTGEPFECIFVNLKPGMFLRLHRNTEVVVVHESKSAAIFHINS